MNTLIEDLHTQGWSIREHFFAIDLIRELRRECTELHETDALQPAGVGRRQGHLLAPAIRKDKIHWLDGATAAQRDYLHTMDQLRLAINQSLFLGLFEYEAHYAVYTTGDYYRKHRDQFTGQRARVVTTVAYLNEDWTAENGGELALYDPANEDVLLRKVAPQAGTLVCFLSEQIPHEVLETHTLRASIAGWFRIRTTS